jgi:sterol desaturase/sphingolipid hydroxylase (fatty acid hydroxylase superfamily)
MSDLILASEAPIRLGIFGIFAAVALGETLAPRRLASVGKLRRWPSNIGIAVVNTVLLRLLFPTAAVGLALLAVKRGWGLLNVVHLPGWAAVALGIVALDLAIYFQHRLFHAVPVLWRLHRMHHADLDFDVTTGARFHPIEIILSMVIKMMVVGALGAPAIAVLTFEVVLSAASMFNHGNLALGERVDRALRLIVVTPDMHRVHHSILPHETNSNFGFSVPWWDWLFGTYKAQPDAGHDAMAIGIGQFRAPRELRLDRMLLQPFRSGDSP